MTIYVVDPSKSIVHRSTDGAETFEPYTTFDAHLAEPSLPAQDTGAPPIWVLWQDSFNVSRDRAVTWQRPPGIPSGRITAIAGDPHDPTVMYALVRGDEIWMYRQPASSLPGR